MKTSVIEVHDMLSVLSVDGVERRIGEVPGVASATVDFAAGKATVRYDETRLEIADIRSIVRQNGYQGDAGAAHEGHAAAGGKSPEKAPAEAKLPAVAPATSGGSSGGSEHKLMQDKSPSPAATAVPPVVSAPTSAAPKASPDVAAAKSS